MGFFSFSFFLFLFFGGGGGGGVFGCMLFPIHMRLCKIIPYGEVLHISRLSHKGWVPFWAGGGGGGRC